ncbi:inorganic pyrophosphatase [Deinococcus sp. 23YEL01]|uniref:inorganic pyrophosphatase n=1 Tax=Deinococcus sp. 23YEL01 TaxID=2745871 RepID=UPI001E59A7A1|nr:inorganic pyrophosphatase [Deinococcus sp. 23YEL01]MCD0169376.1 inorganic pyrophosphatase [Deinococcus sp. 23YEL01]
MTDANFWAVLDTLVADAEVVVERPAGSAHPRFPDTCYPLDYGALRGTTSGDGAEIDVFLGHPGARTVTGVGATVDARKRDTELKLLLDCTPEQMQMVQAFLSWPDSFGCVVLPRPTSHPLDHSGRSGQE